MNSWNLHVGVRLTSAPSDLDAFALGRRIAGDDLLSTSVHETRFSVLASADGGDPVVEIGEFTDRFVEAVAASGYVIEDWELVECLSAAEVERRLESASIPPLISAPDFAELCGFSRQRIYELESDRRKAAERGEQHPFPTPLVPGWWIKTAAERYAATRKSKPGPKPRNA
ncbi:hypothetical protein [Amycolatopsis sp. Poz14]|uniref:hypothetical protein n=1 Tax=Amycolatopsis sp. Poz14 TaxID=1447705 RepID=UPI001EE7B5BE|nr:hypothetical protein [Amycolatopsis sp. Poz14]MCG3757381.1 hypothetical protein [Amycolatopsis sp. Poz14]